ncbi:MAG: TlpA family protein disulfide reductase [Ardenticatenales bacterium]|nr:TlpA family protein disulfide reductase [Ardenticatenales bacterium]
MVQERASASGETRRWLAWLVIVLASGLGWMWLSRVPPGDIALQRSAPQAGFLAPEWTLPQLEGGTTSLRALRGQPIVINFWASWCGPCRTEMPALQQVASAHAEEGLVVLLVNQGESEETIARFRDQMGLTLPILLDKTLSTAESYNVRALPSTFFVDREGRIQEVVIGGPMSDPYLSSRVESLLEGP